MKPDPQIRIGFQMSQLHALSDFLDTHVGKLTDLELAQKLGGINHLIDFSISRYEYLVATGKIDPEIAEMDYDEGLSLDDFDELDYVSEEGFEADRYEQARIDAAADGMPFDEDLPDR